jgi:hypothetical protein
MSEHKIKRMKELMKPIDEQIMLCDNQTELVELASIMYVTACNIFVNTIGPEATKTVLMKKLKEIE